MGNKRVFKTKTFDRWARKIIADAALRDAAREIEAGTFEADLGGGVCKKRIAVPGQGKRGSIRTLVAKKLPHAIVFLAGRTKSAPTSDFTETEVTAAKIVARGLDKADSAKLDELLALGVLREVSDER